MENITVDTVVDTTMEELSTKGDLGNMGENQTIQLEMICKYHMKH